MSATAKFEGPWQLLQWSSLHMSVVEDIIKQYNKRHPYELTSHLGGDGLTHLNIKLTEDIPPELQLNMFDSINAMRASLDHLVHQTTVLLGLDPRNRKFPFGDDKQAYENQLKIVKNGLPKALVDKLESYQVHKDGCFLLWAINKVRNIKHHEILVPMIGAGPNVSLSGAAHFEGGIVFDETRWIPERRELTFMKVRSPNFSIEEIRFELQFSFSPATELGNYEILDTMARLIKICSIIFSDFEALSGL